MRTIYVFGEPLTIGNDGKCYEKNGKEALELEPEQLALSDEELKGELETLLWYDYQDNKDMNDYL
jgi:hypothetical protein